ncbi:hypothetical protein ACFY6U_50545 [Streptomyces sp. NPDC013157]|uniref:hypothetical protein n=1 Tax=unclassified Streptomyces TaxID=2593676 RepID=UPI003417D12B
MPKSKMPRPVEAATVVVAAVWAAFIARDLADHGVDTLVIISVVLAVISAGMGLGTRFEQATHSELFVCPEPGCGVEIRATNQPDERVARLKELATDHSQHPAKA